MNELHLEGPRLVELQHDDVPRAQHRPVREEDEHVRAETALEGPWIIAVGVLGEELLRVPLKLRRSVRSGSTGFYIGN